MPRTRAASKKLHADAGPVEVVEVDVNTEQIKSIVPVSSQPQPLPNPQKKKQVSNRLKSEDSHKNVEQVHQEPSSVFPSPSSSVSPEIHAEIPTKKVAPSGQDKTKIKKIILQKTPSIRKSFEGRLNWKNKHYNNAFTSTPIPPSKMPICSNRDIKTCFGFDDSDDANGSSFISPIFKESEKEKPTRFNVKPQPRRPILKTATTTTTTTAPAAIVPPTRNTENFLDIDIDAPIAEPMIPLSLATNNRIVTEEKEPKKPKKRRTKKTIEAENEEMEKWFENQKREFEDVENCPLMVVSNNEEPKLL